MTAHLTRRAFHNLQPFGGRRPRDRRRRAGSRRRGAARSGAVEPGIPNARRRRDQRLRRRRSRQIVLVRIAKSEMGQGVMTSLAMIVAEELECDFTRGAGRIRLRQPQPDRWRPLSEHGHRRLFLGAEIARVPAAGGRVSARARLIAAAAARWDVAPEACVARAGSVCHDASGRSAAYGALAPRLRRLTLKAEPAIKTPEQFKLIGTRAARLDTPLKVNGEAKFGIDTRVPDMVYAAVANCPVFGRQAEELRRSRHQGPARHHRGRSRRERRRGGRRPILARQGGARRAADRLGLRRGGDDEQRECSAPIIAPRSTARSSTPSTDGDPTSAFAGAAQDRRGGLRSAVSGACADGAAERDRAWRPDRVDVWMGTQSPRRRSSSPPRRPASRPRNVYVHNCFLGGGFGRRSVNDELVQAVQVCQGGRQAGQAGVDARGGHPPRPLPAAGGLAASRGARRRRARRQPSRSAPPSARSFARSAGHAGKRHRADGGRGAGQPALPRRGSEGRVAR